MWSRAALTIGLWAGLAAAASAAILGNHELKIDFTQPQAAAKQATWSDPEHLNCTAQGFGWDGGANASRDGWIETQPLGQGDCTLTQEPQRTFCR